MDYLHWFSRKQAVSRQARELKEEQKSLEARERRMSRHHQPPREPATGSQQVPRWCRARTTGFWAAQGEDGEIEILI